MRHLVWNVALLTTLSTLACRPAADESEVSTLDELATGTVDRAKVCSGKHGALIKRRSHPVSTPLGQVLDETLSAIPESLQREFNRLGGRIVIGGQEMKKECSGSAPAGGACYTFDYDVSKKTFKSLKVILPENAQSIRASTFKVFAYLYAQALGSFSLQNGAVIQVEDSAPLLSRKAAIASAFLRDLARSGQEFSGLQGVLSAKDLLWISEHAGETDFNILSGGMTREDVLGFSEMVFAELMDSEFCNASTATSMRAKYPQAYGASRILVRDIEEHAAFETKARGLQLWETPFGESSGYQYYPSYGGQTYGDNGGYGQYGQETYTGSYVNSNTGNYYNTYQNDSSQSWSQPYSIAGSGGYTQTDSFVRPSGVGSQSQSLAPNMVGD